MNYISTLLLSLGLVLFGFPGSLIAAPVNDAFSAATVVSTFPATLVGTNVDATLEVNEPEPDSYIGSVGQSVWFNWTPAVSGAVRIDTIGSDFDTVLAVWTGSGLTALTEIAFNDQFGGDQSAVFISVTAGVAYRIAVYGYDDANGNITLNVGNDTRATIVGTVTGANGVTPLEDIFVTAYEWNAGNEIWTSVGSAFSQADGTYSMVLPGAGTYRLRFFDSTDEYQPEYYNNAASLGSAQDIVVAASATANGIDASLVKAGRITGKVTATDGVTPLEDIQVRSYYYDAVDQYWTWDKSASTLADGTYNIGGLTADSYRLRFFDSSGGYLSEFYNNAAFVETAASIVVAESAVVSGINASLGQASRITGTVTAQDGTTPLENIEVSLYRSNGVGGWSNVSISETLADGSYNMGGLAAGTYRMKFVDWNSRYVNEYFNNADSLATATDVVVGSAATVSGIDASLAELARITGTVTAADGVTPLGDIQVRAYYWNADDEYWEWDRNTTTQADGSYNLSGLIAKDYRLRFLDNNGEYLTEYYNNAPDLEAAADIEMAQSAVVTGINASLGQASRITGTVTGPDGTTPLEDTEVEAYRSDGSGGWDFVSSALTQADGTYSLGRLTAGTYRVGFFDNNFATEYYNNAIRISTATDIPVGTSSIVSGINASLAQVGRITGTVTGPDGTTPLEDIQVRAYYWDAVEQSWNWDRSAYTQPDGSYNLGRLTADNYRLRFSDGNGNYQTEYYNNAADVASAANIAVAESAVVTGINASLAEFGRITGTVTEPVGFTPLENIEVRAYYWNAANESWYWDQSAITDVNGSYRIGGLTPNRYRLRFSDGDGEYLTEYHINATSLESATDIEVAMSSLISDMDASMELASHITGTVTQADGVTPVEDVEVQSFYWDAENEYWEWGGTAYTEADGSYNLGGLRANRYRLRFTDESGNLATEFFDNAVLLDSATDIEVAASTVVSGINASLIVASSITGTVTGADGVTPLEGIGVAAYQFNGTGGWNYIGNTYSLSDGSYDLDGLTEGIYRVEFFNSDYLSEYYDDVTNFMLASDVVVGVSSIVSGIDASLVQASRISGTVTGPDGITPLDDILVSAYIPDGSGGWSILADTYTGITGSYSIGGLSAGSYRLRFRDELGTYITEFHANAATVASASSLDVGVGATVSGINASLALVPPPTPPEISVEGPTGAVLVDNGTGHNWGSQLVATTSGPAIFTIRNLGDQTLTGVSVSVGGTHAGDIVLGTLPAITVAPGGSTSFTASFRPAAGGARVAVFLIASNDANENPFDVPLAGVGSELPLPPPPPLPPSPPPVTVPEIAVEYPEVGGLADNGAALDFGASTVNGVGQTKTFTIRNLGDGDLTGLVLTTAGNHPGDFVTSPLAVTSLAPGAFTQFSVTFKASDAGARSAVVQIASNDADESPFDISLSGSGTALPPPPPPPAATPEIAVFEKRNLTDGKSTIDFGAAIAKKTSVTKTFTIKNLGKGRLTGLKIQRKGGQVSDFTGGILKSTSLAPGATVKFKVTFKPVSKGKRFTNLLISSNDANERTFEIRLTGEGKTKARSSRVDSDATETATLRGAAE